MALSSLGGEKKIRVPPPVSLATLSLPDPDEQEIAEVASRIVERRTIRLGRDAWQEIRKAESFTGWVAVGKALQIGRDIAVRASGTTTGKHYTRAFYGWADEHGFAGMHKSDRWAAVDLVENLSAITQWRETLPEKECRRLVNPMSNLRRWRKATGQHQLKETTNAQRALAAWRHFVSCVEALPPDQAAPLWQAAQAQAAAILGELGSH